MQTETSIIPDKTTNKTGLHLQWVLGNAKLSLGYEGRYVVGWGLPAVHTCPGAGACKGVCYATQGSYTWSAVRDARERAYQQSLSPGFLGALTADIATLQRKAERKGKRLTVRIHDSGDFYSQTYFSTWATVARLWPEVEFYAYTKSLHLTLDAPSNMHVVQSLGGRYDARVDFTKPHARIFASVEALQAAGYVDGSESDLPAMTGEVKIGLVYHGTRNLTPAQTTYFG